MKIIEIIPNLIALLGKDVPGSFFSDIPIFSDDDWGEDDSGAGEHDESSPAMQAVMTSPGVSILFQQPTGSPATEKQTNQLYLNNYVSAIVLENPSKDIEGNPRNITGKSAKKIAAALMARVQAHNKGAAVANQFSVDNPAYERGPRDLGLRIYYVNFKVKSREEDE